MALQFYSFPLCYINIGCHRRRFLWRNIGTLYQHDVWRIPQEFGCEHHHCTLWWRCWYELWYGINQRSKQQQQFRERCIVIQCQQHFDIVANVSNWFIGRRRSSIFMDWSWRWSIVNATSTTTGTELLCHMSSPIWSEWNSRVELWSKPNQPQPQQPYYD